MRPDMQFFRFQLRAMLAGMGGVGPNSESIRSAWHHQRLALKAQMLKTAKHRVDDGAHGG